jgi:predicted nucleic acid-binding Zn ribbon protein
LSFATLLAIDLGVSVFLAFMAIAVVLPLWPRALSIFGPLVCGKGENLSIQFVKLSYHRPGERGLVAECVSQSGRRTVRFRLLFYAFLASFLVVFLVGLVIAVIVKY